MALIRLRSAALACSALPMAGRMAPTPDTMNETIKLHRASAIIVDRRPESPIERPPFAK